MNPVLARLRRLRPDALIVVLALGLLLAQTLGILHRIDHRARLGTSVTATVATATTVTTATAALKSNGFLKALFGDHSDAQSCELYDQLTHADALWQAPVIVLPESFVPAPAGVHVAWHRAAQAAGFLARGPPVLS